MLRVRRWASVSIRRESRLGASRAGRDGIRQSLAVGPGLAPARLRGPESTTGRSTAPHRAHQTTVTDVRARDRRVRVVVAAGLVALGAGGCGTSVSATSPRAPGATREPGIVAQVTSATCSSSASNEVSRAAVNQCTFGLSDGRRFRCLGSAFERQAPSASTLARANACVALKRLVVPEQSHAVLAVIAAARACLVARGLRVTGGPVSPPSGYSPGGPAGELIVGDAANGAFIAFYSDPRTAQELERKLIENAKHLRGQVNARGAEAVLWIHPPPSGLRAIVQACAFG